VARIAARAVKLIDVAVVVLIFSALT